MDTILWCKKNKNGLKIISPNNNLSEAYFLKAEDALSAMDSVTSADWKIATGYYAMYYALYAILVKTGIESEIHTCTIECMRAFFSDYFSEKDIEVMERAREMRIDAQYYVPEKARGKDITWIIHAAPEFVLKCGKVSRMIKNSDIERIRKTIA